MDNEWSAPSEEWVTEDEYFVLCLYYQKLGKKLKIVERKFPTSPRTALLLKYSFTKEVK